MRSPLGSPALDMSSFLDVGKGQPHVFRAVRRSEIAILSNSGAVNDSADLLCLEDFSDAELLHGLWARYERQQIYTWLGDVLVSVNPYSNVGAFDEEVAVRYAGANAPHLYAVVAQTLTAPGKRHALLITGESGAGKTEAFGASIHTTDSRSAHLDAEAAFHEHLKTAAFVDAVGRSSKFLKAVSPVMVAFTRMSHFLRGMELPAGDGPQIVKNWNTSEEFLEGAEQAYQYALRTAFSPVDSVDLDVTSSHSFRKWVKEQQALYAQDFAESQDFELDSLPSPQLSCHVPLSTLHDWHTESCFW
eukprot:symbB.v1.2.003397.t1/scaffold190.1/size276550/22